MKEEIKKSYWRDSLIVFARMSAWIAGPIVIALFLGKWLDSRFDTAPFIFIICTAFAFFASSLGIVREAKKYMSKISPQNISHGTDITNNSNNK